MNTQTVFINLNFHLFYDDRAATAILEGLCYGVCMNSCSMLMLSISVCVYFQFYMPYWNLKGLSGMVKLAKKTTFNLP